MLQRAACWLVLVGVLAAAAGCGQKGPLYLPDEDREEQQQERDGG